MSDLPGGAAPGGPARAPIAYSLAVALAVAALAWVLPPRYLAGDGGEFAWPTGDVPTFMAGAYAFVDDAWRFPLFDTRRLNEPAGANVIFTDSVPLAALVAKIANRVGAPRFNYLGLWVAAVFLGQALAAVFALRSMGVRSLAWGAAAAALALSTPAFLARHGHFALCAHFLVLLALGLYARTTRAEPSRGTWAAWLALLGASVWVHAYLTVQVGALLAAALVDAWRLGRAPLARLGSIAALSAACVVALAWIGGYLGYHAAGGGPGYGFYSMNLLSPIAPQGSGLLGGSGIDATGGQYEGYNYLGAGALALIVLAIGIAPRSALRLAARHRALVATGALLAAFAVTHQVFLGRHALVELPFVNPAWSVLAALRSSGRFFWPVGYAAVLSAVALLARRAPPRWAGGVLAGGLALVGVQVLDVAPNWKGLRYQLQRATPPAPVDAAVRRLAREHERVLVIPDQRCVYSQDQFQFVARAVFYAAEAGKPTNNAYLARYKDRLDCDRELERVATLRLAPGELLVALVPSVDPRVVAAVAAGGECGALDGVTLCSRSSAVRDELAKVESPRSVDAPACPGEIVFGRGPPLPYASEGLSFVEPWGRWTEGPTARISCRVPSGAARPRWIELEAMGYAPGGAQEVRAAVDGRDAGVQRVPHGRVVSFRLAVPAEPRPELVLQLDVARPSSPREHGESGDPRRLGVGLVRMRLE